MPEIAEVHRMAHFLRLHLTGKTISKVVAPDEPIVFGKAGTSGAEFEAAMKGKKVITAGSQGKYFWIEMDKPPHPVMHFGMTGWIHIKGERTAYTSYYNKLKEAELAAWPPRFWKFQIETAGDPKVELAFTDPRRLGRIRLVDCPGSEIRKNSPLVENGPDPVTDLDVFTEDWLVRKMRSKRVPIKAFLLDQAVISGIGNWVGDEVLFHAKIHPEVYSNEVGEKQSRELFKAIRHVCQTAVDVLGDSDKFPTDWLFKHRWQKGKGAGAAGTLPSGEKLAFLTVGGRTSCYCPAIQKKGGSKDDLPNEVTEPPKASKGKRGHEETVEAKVGTMKKVEKPAKKLKTKEAKEAVVKEELAVETTKVVAKKGLNGAVKQGKTRVKAEVTIEVESSNRRRSLRLSKS